jgi:hypothetical protein
MLGVAAAGVALVAFVFSAILLIAGTADSRLQGVVGYVGLAALALAVFDLANRPR